MDDLDALCARASQLSERATPGPWSASEFTHNGWRIFAPVVYHRPGGASNLSCIARVFVNYPNDETGGRSPDSDDAAFIAASRELVPELLSALTKCREELDKRK